MAAETCRVFANDCGVWREEPGRPVYAIEWDDINGVSAYRLDAIFEVSTIYTLDHPSGHSFEFNGSDEGMAEVVAAITERCPRIPADWGAQVEALTPDDETLVVWERQ